MSASCTEYDRAGHETGCAASSRSNRTAICEPGRLRDLVRLMGLDQAELGQAADELLLPVWRVRANASLLHEGAAAQHLFIVRSGSLKCVKTHEDGYEQVMSFAQPGELLGFEALHCGRQPVAAVALEDTTSFALPIQELAELKRRHPVLDRALQLAVSRQLLRAAETAEMMAAVASEVRLARFLLRTSTRMGELGQSTRRFLLRMGRREIASLLGIAHETVSRSFTTLADAGYLKVDNREIELCDLEALRMRARNTRWLDDEAHPRRTSGARTTRSTMRWHPDAMAA